MLSDRAMARLAKGWRDEEPPEPLVSQATEVGMSLELPLLGGRFRILAPLASGGMGVVYRARDEETGREVAIKMPNLASAMVDRRFELEVDALAAVVAPSVVGFVAKGSAAEPFLAMELLQGQPLSRRLVQGGKVARETGLAIARRIASALAIVHAEGWVHRDVKPGNIAVTEDGEIRLVDFGLARPVLGAGAGTRTGELVGTLSYLAPEQLGGERVVDARTDVFALGCVLYECLTGVHAFKRLTSELVAGMWSFENHPELDPLRLSIEPDVARVILELAAVDPARRPVDGLAALQRLLELDPTGARLLRDAASHQEAVRAATLAALDRPVTIEGPAGSGKTAVALAVTLLLGEVLAPCRTVALRANPRAARVPGQHALVLERAVRAGGFIGAARVLAGHPVRIAPGVDPRLVVLVGDAQYCDDLSMERIAMLAQTGLARVVTTRRDGRSRSDGAFRVELPAGPASDPLHGLTPFERWVLRAGAVFGTVFDVSGAASLVGGPEAARVPATVEELVRRGVLRRSGAHRVAFVRGSAWQSALASASPGDVRLGVSLAEVYEREHRRTEPEVVWLRSTSAVCLALSSGASP